MSTSADLVPSRLRARALLYSTAVGGLTGLTLVLCACGGQASTHVAQLGSATTTTQSSSSSNLTTTTSSSTSSQRMLAFSRCVREHGVPNYPDPDGGGHLPAIGKQIARSSPRFPAAESACVHLLASSGGGGVQTKGDKQKLAFGLKVAQCARRHGFPTYPDPTTPSPASQGSGTRFRGTGIDTKSSRFQTVETACETQARKALGLP